MTTYLVDNGRFMGAIGFYRRYIINLKLTITLKHSVRAVKSNRHSAETWPLSAFIIHLYG